MEIRITHVGTAMVLLEIGPLRIVTDPALDPAGQKYGFGWGTSSKKTEQPALPEGGLGRIDAVLLSHDHHADNLDDLGRKLLPSAGRVLTTVAGARRLGGNAVGLAPWDTAELGSGGDLVVRVTATPARHGPPLSLPLVGHVIGFVLEWPGQTHGPLYISGDTVWFAGVAEVARRFRIGTALLHIGGVRFGITGSMRYTFSGAEAATAATALAAHTIIPIHYEGWTHFRESRASVVEALAAAGLTARTRWLPRGERAVLEV